MMATGEMTRILKGFNETIVQLQTDQSNVRGHHQTILGELAAVGTKLDTTSALIEEMQKQIANLECMLEELHKNPSSHEGSEGVGPARKRLRSKGASVSDGAAAKVCRETSGETTACAPAICEEISSSTVGPAASTNEAACEIVVEGEGKVDELDICLHAPPVAASWRTIDSFVDANEEEQANFPFVLQEFSSYMNALGTITESSKKAYVAAVAHLYRYDAKTIAEMVTEAYLRAVEHTMENKLSNGQHAAGLKHFVKFWKAREEGKPFAPTPEVAPVKIGARKVRALPEQGDGSAQARSAENLPEGWHVHTQAHVTGWASPRGHFYFNKKELRARLGLVPSQALVTPQKKDATASAPDSTPEAPPKPPQALDELLGPPEDHEKAGTEDRELLPRIITTFRRHLGENQYGEKRQVTQDQYVVQLFKLVSTSGRRFDVIAQSQFADLVAASKDSRRSHGGLAAAVRCFGKFWQSVGGYKGKFDSASRADLNLALNVRPMLADHTGHCGQSLPAGEICKRPKQQCVTCGTIFGCSKHGEHSISDCRDTFWCKHTSSGAPAPTVKDFFGRR